VRKSLEREAAMPLRRLREHEDKRDTARKTRAADTVQPSPGRVQRPGRTLMRPPVVKGPKYPVSGWLLFFRLFDAGIVGHRERGLTGGHMRVLHRGCTTHFLRFSRHCRDDCSNQDAGLLRPRNLSVASYRPRHTTGETSHALP